MKFGWEKKLDLLINSTVISVPSPSMDAALISPPWDFMISKLRLNPSPVPLKIFCIEKMQRCIYFGSREY